MRIELGQLIVWIIIGAIAGAVAGRLWRGAGYGLLGNIVIGLLGALLGGIIFQALGINIGNTPTFTFSLADLLIAVLGALILLFIVRLVTRRRF